MSRVDTPEGVVRTDTPVATDRALVVRVVGTVDTSGGPGSTGVNAVTLVAAAAADTPFLAANANRKVFEVMNNADKSLYLLVGAGAASLTNFTAVLAPKNADGVGGYYSPPAGLIWTGPVRGIWGAGPAGNALVTEY